MPSYLFFILKAITGHWVWVCYLRRHNRILSDVTKLNPDMTECTMFWPTFTHLSIWFGDWFVQLDRHLHGAQKHLSPLTVCIYLTTGITSSQFLQHFSELNHWHCVYITTGITSSQFLQHFIEHMHTLCTFFIIPRKQNPLPIITSQMYPECVCV